MRADLERIQWIEQYLMGELSGDEKLEFEKQLQTDNEFAYEVDLQKIVMKRIEKIAIKQEISLAHKKYMHHYRYSFKNKVFRNYFVSISAVITIALSGFFLVQNLNQQEDEIENTALFTPVVERADFPFSYDTVNVETGGIIEPAKNTMILVPPQAFVDSNEVEVKGNIVILYRKFSDAELIGADIRLNIEQNEQQLALESTTACEVYALKDGQPLRIKQGKEIEIIQPSYTTSEVFNIYQYDEENKQWTVKGKDIPLDLSGQYANNQIYTPENFEMHIENPPTDTVIEKQINNYLVLLGKMEELDSVNNAIEKRSVELNEQGIKNDLVYTTSELLRKLKALLNSGITGKTLKERLSVIEINTDGLESNSVLINKEHKKWNNAMKLYYKRQVLLYHTYDEQLISLLIQISPKTHQLLDNEKLIEQEFAIFQTNKLSKLSSSLKISRSYSITKLGLWNVAYPTIKTNEK